MCSPTPNRGLYTIGIPTYARSYDLKCFKIGTIRTWHYCIIIILLLVCLLLNFIRDKRCVIILQFMHLATVIPNL